MGLGTVFLLINAALIWLYTLSCHSCRHIMGGKLKHFSKHPIRYWAWQQISKLNARHMLLAWVSLIWLARHRLLHRHAGHRHHQRPSLLLKCPELTSAAPTHHGPRRTPL